MLRIKFLIFINLTISIWSFGQSKFSSNMANAVSLNYNGSLIGSGFVYEKDSSLYVVTAAHVLYQTDKLQNITEKVKFDTIKVISYDVNDYDKRKTVLSITLIPNETLK